MKPSVAIFALLLAAAPGLAAPAPRPIPGLLDLLQGLGNGLGGGGNRGGGANAAGAGNGARPAAGNGAGNNNGAGGNNAAGNPNTPKASVTSRSSTAQATGTPSKAQINAAVDAWMADTSMVSDFQNKAKSLSGQDLKKAAKVALDAELDELTHKAVLDRAFGDQPEVQAANNTLDTKGRHARTIPYTR